MGYKVGDEVLVRCKVLGQLESGRYKVTNFGNSSIETATVRAIYPIEEEVISKNMESEGWNFARYIIASENNGGISSEDFYEIFGIVGCSDIIEKMSYQEAKAKIEAWKAAKEIKVGDEVKDCNGKIGVVISKGTSDNVLFSDGSTWNYTERTLEKTGRHIDIIGLLKQIGWDEQ